MLDYIIVSPDPDDSMCILYLREAGDDHSYWTRAQKQATRYATYGAAKLAAQRRLPHYRNYLIRSIPSTPGAK